MNAIPEKDYTEKETEFAIFCIEKMREKGVAL